MTFWITLIIVGGNSVQLYGFCNRIGYTKYPNESDTVFHERVKVGIEKDLEDGGYDDEDVSDIPFKMYLFNIEDDFTGHDFMYSAHASWLNGDIVASLDKTSVSLPKYKILSSTTFTQGNVIVYDSGSNWLPSIYRRFAPLDIVVGNKTFYAFWNADFIDQYYQAGYGETFDGHCISGLSFEEESTNQTPGFSGSTVTILNGGLLYTDSLNTNVACWNSGDLAYSSDLENVGYSFGYRTGYEYITISGGNVVSALCFMDIAAIETYDEETGDVFRFDYPSIVRYASGDVVVDGITYYCFKADDCMYYLTDISEGRKLRFYTNAPSGFGNSFISLEEHDLEFLTSYSGLTNVTANSGNTFSWTMDNEAENIHETMVFNYFEPYNIVEGGVTFYAYIPSGCYKTGCRVLSTQESGITSGLDTRLYAAMCNENAGSNLIYNGKMQAAFMTDISQGSKNKFYSGEISMVPDSPNSVSGQVSVNNRVASTSESFEGVTFKITDSKLRVPFTISDGLVTASVYNGVPSTTLYPYSSYDIVLNGTTYHAFSDVDIDTSEYTDDDVVEFTRMFIGTMETNESPLVTSENSMDLFYLDVNEDGSYTGRTIYKGEVSIMVDPETGDGYLVKYLYL